MQKSKQRYISTSFWDDRWVSGLRPTDKLLYLYLLTNTLTNIAGVYKLTERRISFDTGLDIDMVREGIDTFQEAGKAYLHGEYMVIPAWPQHQKWESRSRIRAGIEAILSELSPEVKKYMISIGYRYPINGIGKGYVYESNYLESESESESDLEPDREIEEDTLSGQSPDPVDAFIEKEKKEAVRVPAAEIIDYLNEKANSSFTAKNKQTVRLLKARWNEGYRLPDFKAVIDIKGGQWMADPKMVSYLRPATLFGPKFESYLNEHRKSDQHERNRCPECGHYDGEHLESCTIYQGTIDAAEAKCPSCSGKLKADPRLERKELRCDSCSRIYMLDEFGGLEEVTEYEEKKV